MSKNTNATPAEAKRLTFATVKAALRAVAPELSYERSGDTVYVYVDTSRPECERARKALSRAVRHMAKRGFDVRRCAVGFFGGGVKLDFAPFSWSRYYAANNID